MTENKIHTWPEFDVEAAIDADKIRDGIPARHMHKILAACKQNMATQGDSAFFNFPDALIDLFDTDEGRICIMELKKRTWDANNGTYNIHKNPMYAFGVLVVRTVEGKGKIFWRPGTSFTMVNDSNEEFLSDMPDDATPVFPDRAIAFSAKTFPLALYIDMMAQKSPLDLKKADMKPIMSFLLDSRMMKKHSIRQQAVKIGRFATKVNVNVSLTSQQTETIKVFVLLSAHDLNMTVLAKTGMDQLLALSVPQDQVIALGAAAELAYNEIVPEGVVARRRKRKVRVFDDGNSDDEMRANGRVSNDCSIPVNVADSRNGPYYAVNELCVMMGFLDTVPRNPLTDEERQQLETMDAQNIDRKIDFTSVKVISIKKHPAALFWDEDFNDKIPDAVWEKRPKPEEDLAHLVYKAIQDSATLGAWGNLPTEYEIKFDLYGELHEDAKKNLERVVKAVINTGKMTALDARFFVISCVENIAVVLPQAVAYMGSCYERQLKALFVTILMLIPDSDARKAFQDDFPKSILYSLVHTFIQSMWDELKTKDPTALTTIKYNTYTFNIETQPEMMDRDRLFGMSFPNPEEGKELREVLIHFLPVLSSWPKPIQVNFEGTEGTEKTMAVYAILAGAFGPGPYKTPFGFADSYEPLMPDWCDPVFVYDTKKDRTSYKTVIPEIGIMEFLQKKIMNCVQDSLEDEASGIKDIKHLLAILQVDIAHIMSYFIRPTYQVIFPEADKAIQAIIYDEDKRFRGLFDKLNDEFSDELDRFLRLLGNSDTVAKRFQNIRLANTRGVLYIATTPLHVREAIDSNTMRLARIAPFVVDDTTKKLVMNPMQITSLDDMDLIERISESLLIPDDDLDTWNTRMVNSPGYAEAKAQYDKEKALLAAAGGDA